MLYQFMSEKGVVTLSKAICVIVSAGSLQLMRDCHNGCTSQTRFSTTVISEREHYFLLLRITIAAVGVFLAVGELLMTTKNKQVGAVRSVTLQETLLASISLFNVAALKAARAQARINTVKMLTALIHQLLALQFTSV